jgi:hypothetical protein
MNRIAVFVVVSVDEQAECLPLGSREAAGQGLTGETFQLRVERNWVDNDLLVRRRRHHPLAVQTERRPAD